MSAQRPSSSNGSAAIFSVLSSTRASVRALIEESESSSSSSSSSFDSTKKTANNSGANASSSFPSHNGNASPLQKLLSSSSSSRLSSDQQLQDNTNSVSADHNNNKQHQQTTTLISNLRRRAAAAEEAQLRAEQQAAEATSHFDALRQRLHAAEEERDDAKKACHSLTEQRLGDRAQVHRMAERGTRLEKEVAAFEAEAAVWRREARQAVQEVARCKEALAGLMVKMRDGRQQDSAAQIQLEKVSAECRSLEGKVELLEQSAAAREVLHRTAAEEKTELERRHRLLADQLEVVSGNAAASQQALFDTESLLRSAVDSRDNLQRMVQVLQQQQFEALTSKTAFSADIDVQTDAHELLENKDDRPAANGNDDDDNDDDDNANVDSPFHCNREQASCGHSIPSAAATNQELQQQLLVLLDRVRRHEGENDALLQNVKDKNFLLARIEAQLSALQKDHASLTARQHVTDAVEAHARAVQARCTELERAMLAAPALFPQQKQQQQQQLPQHQPISSISASGPAAAAAAAVDTSTAAVTSTTGRRTRFNDQQNQQPHPCRKTVAAKHHHQQQQQNDDDDLEDFRELLSDIPTENGDPSCCASEMCPTQQQQQKQKQTRKPSGGGRNKK